MTITEDRVTLILADLASAPGRHQRVIWELATRLPPQRYDVRVWLAADPAADELASALEERDVAVERIREVASIWDVRSLLGLRVRLKRARPRAIHLHAAPPGPGRTLGVLADAAGPTPIVLSLHGAEAPGAPAAAALKRTLDRAQAVTLPCAALGERLMREAGALPASLRVVPQGVDLPDEEAEMEAARVWRHRLRAGVSRPLWTCAARLEPAKCHAVLLDALAILMARGLEFSCALVGDGPLRAALEARTHELGLESRVHFLGDLPEWQELLAAADTVVLPSSWEAQPLVLIEAMMRARPVVASSVGGIPEMIGDGIHGSLVPPGEPEPLAAALEAYHRRPAQAMDVGRRAARSARETFAWERVVESYEAVYDEILGLASFTTEEEEIAERG